MMSFFWGMRWSVVDGGGDEIASWLDGVERKDFVGKKLVYIDGQFVAGCEGAAAFTSDDIWIGAHFESRNSPRHATNPLDFPPE